MFGRISRGLALQTRNLNQCPEPTLSYIQTRLDSSGIGSARQVKDVDIVRKCDRISEILTKVKNRDGLTKPKSHIEHLVGRLANEPSDGKAMDMAGLDIGNKTELIMQSCHPVRYTLEREIYDHSRTVVSYHNWITLFGRGIRVTKNPKYEEILDFVSKASGSGMFSTDIHETVVNIPEDAIQNQTEFQFSLGNKYSVLVGDYFAIRCIYFAEKTKTSKVLIAISKGVEESSSANFASKLLDPQTIYPFLPNSNATVQNWMVHNKKISGYFNGGLYGMLLVNYGRLPQSEEFMTNLKLFSSNISVLLRGVAELEGFENVQDLTRVSPHSLTSLPAILYQQKDPTGFDYLRRKAFALHDTQHFKKLTEDVEQSSAIQETKFILGGLALEAKRNFEKISTDQFYTDVIQDLIDAVVSFD